MENKQKGGEGISEHSKHVGDNTKLSWHGPTQQPMRWLPNEDLAAKLKVSRELPLDDISPGFTSAGTV